MKYLKKFSTEAEYNAFIESGAMVKPNVSVVEEGGVYYNPIELPLYVEALEDMLISAFTGYNVQYSYDNNTWVNWRQGTNYPTLTLEAGKRLYLRATPEGTDIAGIESLSLQQRCNVGGNVLSVSYGENYVGKVAIPEEYPNSIQRLFSGCKGIVSAKKLIMPRGLTTSCFYDFFHGCTNLIEPPALPAQILKPHCYTGMFYGCTSLKTAPVLPAENLAKNCYYLTFADCSQLSYVKAMFVTPPSGDDIGRWLRNVSDTGVFVKNSKATWEITGDSGIPSGWTILYE